MTSPPRTPSLLERWARFSCRHAWPIVGAWLGILAGLTFANMRFGGEFITVFRIPGSEAQEARDLLRDRFPGRAGDSGSVVFKSERNIASDAPTRDAIGAVLAAVDEIPTVASIESPLDNAGLISADGTIARAAVHFSERSNDLPDGDVKRFIRIADDANTPGLRVEAGGHVVGEQERPDLGSEWIGLVAAMFILLVAFGSVAAMGLPIGAAIFGLGAGFALVGLAANVAAIPSFSPQFMAMIGIGVGIDYSLLIVTRFREGLHAGESVEDAVILATSTSGRAVAFAGAVVAAAFLGLTVMGVPFVAALGVAGATVVIAAALVALTLMPAALALIGHRVDRWHIPLLHSTEGVDETSWWFRLSAAIQRRPILYMLAAAAVLVTLATPVLTMRLGFTDDGNNPTSYHTRRAYDLLVEGFGPGFNGPLILAAKLPEGRPAGAGTLDAIAAAVAGDRGVAEVNPPIVSPTTGTAAVIQVYPRTSPQDGDTQRLVHRLREDVLPSVTAGSGIEVYVGGATASTIDARDRITSRMPYLFAGVIGTSFVLLTVVFRAVVVAAKAAIVNLLSIGASYGVLVAIFQWGWGASLFGVEPGPIETFLPMMMFAILFGLSMDYEVFLISRVREEYARTRDNANSVSHGLAATARVITAAAAIMVAVFLTFVFGDVRVIKEFGIGLATAIFVDATIVRLVLVPSTMELLGDRNWWLPRWLDRILPHIHLEAAPEP